MNINTYLKAVGGLAAVSLGLFALPLFLVDTEIAMGYICGIPPQLFITLSWVGGYVYAQRNCPEKTFLYTLGLIPIRFLVEIAWFLLLMQVEDVNIMVAVGSAILHFALFTIPQTITINSDLSAKTS